LGVEVGIEESGEALVQSKWKQDGVEEEERARVGFE
jgi:hypothetical protein